MKLVKSVPSLFLAVALLAASPSASVSADEVTPNLVSIVVNTNADNLSNDGVCSLREAILSANLNSDLYGCSGAATTDIITFAANYTITLGNSDLFVQSPITIIGNGATNTIIQADPQAGTANDRVFEVAANGNLTLNDLAVRYGVSDNGGGIYNTGTLTIVNSQINSNNAQYGGGIYNSGALTITNSSMNSNEVSEQGGGIYNTNSNTALTNVEFWVNEAFQGGGMYNLNSNPTLTGVRFAANYATGAGAGMYNNNSHPNLTYADIVDNQTTVDGWGGGIYNIESNPFLTNVSFVGNTAGSGGGMLNYNSSPTLTGVTFSNNSSSQGGGIHNANNSNPALINVTISGNTAGGGMYTSNNSGPNLTNTILWGNNPSGTSASSAFIKYSVVQGAALQGQLAPQSALRTHY